MPPGSARKDVSRSPAATQAPQRSADDFATPRGATAAFAKILSFVRDPRMTYVVTESCIRCKYTDCVDVCPVDCFREGPNMLVIDPDECIDCAVCIPECPVNAIYA